MTDRALLAARAMQEAARKLVFDSAVAYDEAGDAAKSYALHMLAATIQGMDPEAIVAALPPDETAESLATLERPDREAATYVESVIVMRTDFTGEPPYTGWKGLGLALNEALDERDRLRAVAVWRPMSEAPRDGTRVLGWGPNIGPIVVEYTGATEEPEFIWASIEGVYHADLFTHWAPLPTPPATEESR